jgi:hypothetical protein
VLWLFIVSVAGLAHHISVEYRDKYLVVGPANQTYGRIDFAKKHCTTLFL